MKYPIPKYLEEITFKNVKIIRKKDHLVFRSNFDDISIEGMTFSKKDIDAIKKLGEKEK